MFYWLFIYASSLLGMGSASSLLRVDHYSSDSEQDNTSSKNKKRKHKNDDRRQTRPQKYRTVWENNPSYRGWLQPVPGKPQKSQCIACNTEFTADITVIKNHSTGAKHVKAVSAMKKAREGVNIKTFFQKSTEEDQQVKRAEIKIAALIAKHNLSMKLCDYLIPLLKDIFPDSKIAQKITLQRTKATKIITNVLGEHHFQVIVSELKQKKFSILIDESTDIGTIKNLCVCVRFFCEKAQTVVSKFFTLIQCFSKENPGEADEGATAENIYKKLMNAFTAAKIPFSNIIGFGSDGCNTMFGSNNSVVSRLKEELPGIMVQKCICHSLHLCASEACKLLPRHCENLAREIYNFFKNSSKRQTQFLQFQHFCDVQPHKILRPSQTRWLSLSSVVDRILEQWGPLQLYFSDQWLSHRLQSSENIMNRLNDGQTKLFFFFLQWVLPKFTDTNKYFQNERVVLTSVYSKLSEMYKSLLRCYMNANYIDKENLADIDPTDASKFVALQNMYLSVSVMQNIENIGQTEKDDFYIRCRQFLIMSCLEIKKRFNFQDSILAQLSIFDPVSNKNSAPKPISIYPLMKQLPRIININNSKDSIQKIDDQWRLYCQKINELPDDIKSEKSIDRYWYKISEIKDMAEICSFKELANFVLDILVIPHSNATCERIFSKINLTKTDVRNSLYSDTIKGLVLASESIIDGVHNFCVDAKLISLMTNDIYTNKKSDVDVNVTFETVL